MFLHFNSGDGRHFYSAFRSDSLRKKKTKRKTKFGKSNFKDPGRHLLPRLQEKHERKKKSGYFVPSSYNWQREKPESRGKNKIRKDWNRPDERVVN